MTHVGAPTDAKIGPSAVVVFDPMTGADLVAITAAELTNEAVQLGTGRHSKEVNVMNGSVPQVAPWNRETLTLSDNYACPICECVHPSKTERLESGGFSMVWATCSQDHVYMLDYERVKR